MKHFLIIQETIISWILWDIWIVKVNQFEKDFTEVDSLGSEKILEKTVVSLQTYLIQPDYM